MSNTEISWTNPHISNGKVERGFINRIFSIDDQVFCIGPRGDQTIHIWTQNTTSKLFDTFTAEIAQGLVCVKVRKMVNEGMI